ncbi:hypothetical protein GCM10010442_74140 [Kitasatospora kifunensis]
MAAWAELGTAMRSVRAPRAATAVLRRRMKGFLFVRIHTPGQRGGARTIPVRHSTKRLIPRPA